MFAPPQPAARQRPAAPYSYRPWPAPHRYRPWPATPPPPRRYAAPAPASRRWAPKQARPLRSAPRLSAAELRPLPLLQRYSEACLDFPPVKAENARLERLDIEKGKDETKGFRICTRLMRKELNEQERVQSLARIAAADEKFAKEKQAEEALTHTPLSLLRQEITTELESLLPLMFKPYAPLGTLPLTYVPGKDWQKENQVRPPTTRPRAPRPSRCPSLLDALLMTYPSTPLSAPPALATDGHSSRTSARDRERVKRRVPQSESSF